MAARLPALQQRIGAVPWWSHAPVPTIGQLTVSETFHCRPPKLGEPHPLTTLEQEGFVRVLAAQADDGNARQIESALLGSTAVLTSGHSVLVDAMGTTRKTFLPRFHSSCELTLISSRAARWELEEGLTKPLPGEDCIFFVDAARYDETPMLVKSRGQSMFGQLLGPACQPRNPLQARSARHAIGSFGQPIVHHEHVVLPEPVRRRRGCYLWLRGKDLAIGVSICYTLEA